MQTSFRSLSSLQYIHGLDGLRAISVLLVILNHYISPFEAQFNTLFAGTLLTGIAKIGLVGVDIFFVISGFLMTSILMRKPIKTFADYQRFIVSRAWRLLPAYLFCLLIFSVVAATFTPNSKVLIHSWSLWTFTSNIQSSFISRSALMDNHYALIHFWSLALEWHFYLLLPWLILITRSYTLLAFLLILLAIGTRLLFQKAGISDNAIYGFSFCRFDAFAMGILLARYSAHIKPNLSKWIGLIGLGMFVAMLTLAAINPMPFKKIVWIQQYGYSLLALSIALFLLPVINHSAQFAIQCLEQPWLTAIGRASYSLYIWHIVFFPMIGNMVFKLQHSLWLNISLTLTLNIIFAAIITALTYRFIEVNFYASYRTKAAQLN